MKGIVIAFGVLALSFANGCSIKQGAESKNIERFEQSNWAKLDSDPDAHKGAQVEIIGKVFMPPDKTDKGAFWQMWANTKDSKYNTLVAYSNPDFTIKNGDFVRVTGVVRGKHTGENAFGAKVTALIIDADSATVMDALAVASPAKYTASVNQSQKQHDLTVSIEKIEFAEDETRVFLKINNASKNKGSFFSHGTKIQQGKKQFDSVYKSDYPQAQSEILPGVETAGVISFPVMAKEQTKLILEARTDNYYLNFKPYIFDIQP